MSVFWMTNHTFYTSDLRFNYRYITIYCDVQRKSAEVNSPPVFPAELCPEESTSQDTQDRDLTPFINEMGPELFNVFESIIKDEEGTNSLMKLVYHALIGGKDN